MNESRLSTVYGIQGQGVCVEECVMVEDGIIVFLQGQTRFYKPGLNWDYSLWSQLQR